jgi:hypothetical protein
MPKTWLPTLALSLLAAPVFAGDVPAREITFTRDILPIVQQNCVTCHRPGGQNIAGMVAPFSLLNYEETRPWAKSIAEVVASKKMPPWYASEASKGVFKNERGLTPEQIATLVEWVRTGAKRGNPADAPAPVHYEDNGGWIIGKPDLEVKLPQPYLVKDSVVDEYHNFFVDVPADQLPGDRWLRAIEWKPGSQCVHHIVGFELYKDENGVQQRQGLGSIAPGEEPPIFSAGYGRRLHKGARIVFQMHYHKEQGPGTEQLDQSSVGFRFWDDKKDPPIRHAVVWDGIANPRLRLDPGAANVELKADRTFSADTSIISLHPHMHLRGKSAQYVAHYPDGSQETLLTVPSWDFAWQLDYTFREPKRIPAGTKIEYTAVFDNSAGNPANPDPSIAVHWGEATTDEMMIGFINYTNTEEQRSATD